MKFSERLKQLRAEAGLSQSDMGKIIKISKSSVNMYERGEREPGLDTLEAIADHFNVDMDYLLGKTETRRKYDFSSLTLHESAVRIPVYGKVAAGIPIAAVTDFSSEDPDDWEEIPAQMARSGEYIALRIDGDSMEPRIRKGDVVIVRLQEQVESGDIAIVFVNGDDAVCKRVRWTDAGLTLISSNPSYEPLFFTPAEVESLPVRFLGKVVELRGKL